MMVARRRALVLRHGAEAQLIGLDAGITVPGLIARWSDAARRLHHDLRVVRWIFF